MRFFLAALLLALPCGAIEDFGDWPEDATVYVDFWTYDSSGAPVAPSDAFEAADVAIYKNNSATQKTSTNGVTMTSPFDAVTGYHEIAIDTSNDTGDAGFWATGSTYRVVLSPDTETVDSQSVGATVGYFSIQARYMRGTDSAATATALSTAQTDLDTLTGADGATLATSQSNYAPNTATPLDAAGVRTAVGLASANLDTQLGTLSTHGASDVWSIALPGAYGAGTAGLILGSHTPQSGDSYARLGAPAGASLSADVAAVKLETASILTDTNELQTDWADGGRLDTILDTASTAGVGGGAVTVTSSTLDDSGDSMEFETSGGAGVADATVRAYVKSEYDVGTFTIRAVATTADDGTWGPIYLDGGVEYILTFQKTGFALATTVITPEA